MTNSKENYAISKGLKTFFVEYLRVTAKGHGLKEYMVQAMSKAEARGLCPYMTTTGRVREQGEIFSCLKVVANADSLKSDRGCRVF